MDSFVLGIVLIAVVLGFGVVIAVLNARMRELKNQSAAEMVKGDVVELTRTIAKLQESMGDKIDRNNATVQHSLQQQLTQSNKIIADITRDLTELKASNKQVVDVADGLKSLQNILQNPKQRGGVGEYYLETVLGNVLPPNVYQMQYKFKDGEIVDAVIKLDKGRLIPIDSKFSLENYNRLIEEKDKTARESLVRAFKTDLKNRIDETSKYIRPREDTLDYAFMFIPSEAIYYDLLVNNIGATGTNSRDLIEYAFIDKKVIIVSPTTLLAYLQTVLQGLRSLQIEETAKDIQKRVGELGKHITAHETYMQKLGASLGTSVNHFNSAHKSLAQMDKDVLKIADESPGVEPVLLERPSQDD